jgi:hypothetical protein
MRGDVIGLVVQEELAIHEADAGDQSVDRGIGAGLCACALWSCESHALTIVRARAGVMWW